MKKNRDDAKLKSRNPETFSDMRLKKEILSALDRLNFRAPTDVQRKVIPIALSGRDVMVQSRTGTGKTAAFGLPILENLDSRGQGIKALILAPTRELTLQITRELGRYNKSIGAHIVAIYGGQKIQTQFNLLKKGADIVVSTPGRLIDHLKRCTISLSNIKTVVLDEADRMLDMGFIEDIVYILKHTPKDRQTMLYTATLLPEVQMLAKDFMRRPERIMLSRDELVVPEIDETFYRIGRKNKLWALMQVINREEPTQGIVFCETKRMVDIVAERLHKLRIKAVALHGDLRQSRREGIMRKFRKGEFRFLVATDVAARGLDIPAVSHVFNYDVPENKEQYVHRVGRTGRIGAKGRAITFVSKENFHAVSEIEKFLKREIEFEQVPEDTGRREMRVDSQGKIQSKRVVRDTRKNPLRKVLDFDDLADEFGMVKMRLNAGKKHGVTKFDLAQYLSEGDYMWDMNIGAIDVSERETVIEIKKHAMHDAMRTFQKKPYRGHRIYYEIIEQA